MNRLWAALILTIAITATIQARLDLPPVTPPLPETSLTPSQSAVSPRNVYILVFLSPDGSILCARGGIAEKNPLKPVFRDAHYGTALYLGYFAMAWMTDPSGMTPRDIALAIATLTKEKALVALTAIVTGASCTPEFQRKLQTAVREVQEAMEHLNTLLWAWGGTSAGARTATRNASEAIRKALQESENSRCNDGTVDFYPPPPKKRKKECCPEDAPKPSQYKYSSWQSAVKAIWTAASVGITIHDFDTKKTAAKKCTYNITGKNGHYNVYEKVYNKKGKGWKRGMLVGTVICCDTCDDSTGKVVWKNRCNLGHDYLDIPDDWEGW